MNLPSVPSDLQHLVEDYEFVAPAYICQLMGISRTTCKRRRLQGDWKEGIHWIRISQTCVRYNLPLIRDWMINHRHPAVHQRAIDYYVDSLLSNQKQKRKAKPKTA